MSGPTVPKSIDDETVRRGVEEGTNFGYIHPPDLEATIAWDPERVARTAVRRNRTNFLHDGPDETRCVWETRIDGRASTGGKHENSSSR